MSLPGGHKRCTFWTFWIDQNSRAVCKTMVAMEIEMHSRAWGAARWQANLPSLLRSERHGSCSLSYHTCFESLVALTFVRSSSENIAFIRIYFEQHSCIASIVGCGHSYRLINRFEVHSVNICACANDFTLAQRNKPKTKSWWLWVDIETAYM